jgi:NADPH2:quinone reductase
VNAATFVIIRLPPYWNVRSNKRQDVSSMKVIGLQSFGGPEVLEALELPEPHAGQGEVRLRVRAATVNPADTLIRSGGAAAAFADSRPPYIPGLEAAGELDEIGPGTETALRLGTRVMAMVNPTRPAGGAYADYLVLPASWVVAAPAGTTHAEAATVPMNGLTARRALDQLRLTAGEWIAISGAAGAVGGYAVQLAKADGLQVIADASERDVELVRALGADIVIARGPDFGLRVRLHFGAGAAALIDAAAIGAAAVDAVRDQGQIAVVREIGGQQGVSAAAASRGITVHKTFVHDYDGNTAALARLSAQVESGALTTRVAQTMPARSAAEAHRILARGGTRGRLVLTF